MKQPPTRSVYRRVSLRTPLLAFFRQDATELQSFHLSVTRDAKPAIVEGLRPLKMTRNATTIWISKSTIFFRSE